MKTKSLRSSTVKKKISKKQKLRRFRKKSQKNNKKNKRIGGSTESVNQPTQVDSEAESEEALAFRDITPSKLKLYFILRSGCRTETNIEKIQKQNQSPDSLAETYENSKLKEDRLDISETFSIPEENVTIFCEQGLFNIVMNMASEFAIGKFFSSKLEGDAIQLVESIKHDIASGNIVYIYGYSYGGAIANKIATVLQRDSKELLDKLKNQLFITTCGSPFIANFDSINQINITNYLHIGDGIVKTYSGQVEPDINELEETLEINNVKKSFQATPPKNDSSVIWVKNERSKKWPGISNLLGMSLSNYIHNHGYDGLELVKKPILDEKLKEVTPIEESTIASQ
jgi:hypothetical protein